MSQAQHFTPRLILAGAAMFGVLLALGVHMIGVRFGLNLGQLWSTDGDLIPAKAAIAWWLICAVAFVGGYVTATLLHSAVSGQIPRRMRQFLIGVGLLLLIAAGQAASAPNPVPSASGLVTGLVALILGAVMASAGAHFALAR